MFCAIFNFQTRSSVFATTVKAETNAELKNRVYEEVLNLSLIHISEPTRP